MAERTLQQAIDEHNRLAKPAPPPDHTVWARVVVPGVYNGAHHRALPAAKSGDIIAVASGWYAAELVEAGLVERYEPDELDEAIEEAMAEEPEPEAESPLGAISDLDELTVVELRDLARDAGVDGYSSLRKAQLLEALRGLGNG